MRFARVIAAAGLLMVSSAVAADKAQDAGLVDGVGGVFMYAKDTAKLAKWYTETLGLSFTSDASDGHHYVIFQHADKNITVFALFPATNEKPAGGSFIVNLRLKDYDGALKRLRARGVTIEREEDYDYGRFAWFADAEGNQIEVWQPKPVLRR